MESDLKFDLQTRSQTRIKEMSKKISQTSEKSKVKKYEEKENGEKIRAMIDSLLFELDESEKMEKGGTKNVKTSFVEEERQLLASLVSMSNDIYDEEAEIFIIRARKGNETVGFFNGIIKPRKKEVDVIDYFVREDLRGQKVANQMHEYMERVFKDRGMERLVTIMDDEKIAGRALLNSRRYKAEKDDEDNVDFYLDI